MRRFWGIPLAELWSNPVSLQEILRFLESLKNPRSWENPSRSWMICEMVSLHPRWTPFLAYWRRFFFLPVIVLDTELCRTEALEVLEGFNHAVRNLTRILNLKLWENPPPGEGGYFRNFGVGMCRWDPGTLAYTRARSSEFCYPILD